MNIEWPVDGTKNMTQSRIDFALIIQKGYILRRMGNVCLWRILKIRLYLLISIFPVAFSSIAGPPNPGVFEPVNAPKKIDKWNN